MNPAARDFEQAFNKWYRNSDTSLGSFVAWQEIEQHATEIASARGQEVAQEAVGYIRQQTLDFLRTKEVRGFSILCHEYGYEEATIPVYVSPPACVPVEDLKALCEKWRKADDSWWVGKDCADELASLIERNGG